MLGCNDLGPALEASKVVGMPLILAVFFGLLEGVGLVLVDHFVDGLRFVLHLGLGGLRRQLVGLG